MQIEQIEYIVEVAKTGSISEAAHNVHVSAATISQSISNFEKKYGVKIFNRSRLGTTPTDQGKVIIEKALEIKNKILELEKETISQNATNEEELKLVISPSVLQSLIPKAFSLFKTTFPNITIEIMENQNVVEEMLNHEKDIGFFLVDEKAWIKAANLYRNVLHFETLLQGKMYVCVNKDSPIAYKDSIAPEELGEQTVVLYHTNRPTFDDINTQYGNLKLLFESINIATIKNSIIEGLGISFLSDFTLRKDPSVENGLIIPVPLVNYVRPNLIVGYIRSKKRPYSTSSREFIKMIQDLIKEAQY